MRDLPQSEPANHAALSRPDREKFPIFSTTRPASARRASERRMSLRTRVVALVGLVLLFGLAAGALLVGYEARRTLDAELKAGVRGAESTVRTALEDLPRSDHPDRDLRQLIEVFDGARHVRASLFDASGRRVAESEALDPGRPAPAWFVRMLGRPPAPAHVAVPGGGRIVLKPVIGPDAGAVWAECAGLVAALATAAVIALALIWAVIGAALRPLRDLAEGLARVGAGDYAARAPALGPSDLVPLEEGFNAMAGRLAAMDERNRALERQMLTLQDEERADVARDLHDEIGQHLFAVNIDAQMIGRLVGTGRDGEIGEQVKAIQAAVAHMQRHVRDLIAQLRPPRVTELGLNAAIDDLAAFWRKRRPDLSVELEVAPEDADLPDALTDTVYRVVQEALSNAARHADARLVRVAVDRAESGLIVRVSDDGARASPRQEPGFGLIGMRERVRAWGGTLEIETRKGWTVTARLPFEHRAAAGEGAAA
jgi:two-component system sensor histidine kinase UhpB